LRISLSGVWDRSLSKYFTTFRDHYIFSQRQGACNRRRNVVLQRNAHFI